MLTYQLQHDSDVAGRLEAVKLLHGDPAVATAARNDAVWAVRTAAAAELSDAKSLVALLHDRDSRVRWSAAQTLGDRGFSTPEVVVGLKEIVAGDSSLYVRGNALQALAKLDTAAAMPMIRIALAVDSWTDIERTAAVRALSLTHSPDAFSWCSQLVTRTGTRFARLAALEALVVSARESGRQSDAAAALAPLLDDPDLFIRESVARSLGTLAVSSSTGALESRKRVEAEGRVLSAIADALTAIRSGKQ
jgi:HEAT repeat protein